MENSARETVKEKVCRACVDFKLWTKNQFEKQYKNVSQLEPEKTVETHKNCPLDVSELGRASWSLLHTIAAYYPKNPSTKEKNDMKEFIRLFSEFYPCDICAHDLRERLKLNLPHTSSQNDLSLWLCDLHNQINLRLNKPIFDCSSVNERWRDGWKDGSCD